MILLDKRIYLTGIYMVQKVMISMIQLNIVPVCNINWCGFDQIRFLLFSDQYAVCINAKLTMYT